VWIAVVDFVTPCRPTWPHASGKELDPANLAKEPLQRRISLVACGSGSSLRLEWADPAHQ
jgi:hypothetical protein